MFADSFPINAILFALAQLAAWGYLRTGLVRRGATLMAGTWVLADVALVARFAYQGLDVLFWVSLVAMQLYACVEFALFVSGRLRRRSARGRRRRDELYRRAFVHYLRDELEPAAAIHRQLLRRDPWDLDAVLSLAVLSSRRGRRRRARGMLRAARALDRESRYRDLIDLEMSRVVARAR